MVRVRTVLLGTGLGMLLAGCGGGSAGGSAVVSQLRGVSVTSSNVTVATAVAMDASNVADGASGGVAFLTGVVTQPVKSDFHFAAFALQQLARIAAQPPAGNTVTGVSGSGSQDCADAGRVLYSVTASNPSYLSAGDVFHLQFVGCQENGSTLDGSFAMTVNTVSANFDPGAPVAPYNLTIATELGNFSAVDATSNVLANGDLTIATSDNGAGYTTLGLSGNALGAKEGAESGVLTDYDFYLTSDSTNGDFTLDAMATVGSSKLGGSVSFATTTTFAGNINQFNGYPSSGVLEITSNIDASNATVTAESDGTTVTIQLDETGSGSPVTIMTTWSELAAL
jgi:hypothetical protein